MTEQEKYIERHGAFKSESEKYRHLTEPYCVGAGVDIGSQGAAVVPWAISFDQPEATFLKYSGGQPPKGPIHLRGDARKLPFESDSLDFAYASHLLEDYPLSEWPAVVGEWARTVRHGGYVIILCPEKTLWAKYTEGRVDLENPAHRYEPVLGDFMDLAPKVGLKIEVETMTNLHPDDFTILAVFRKPLK